MVGGGEKKFYASTKSNGEVTLEGLTHSIERTSTVSGADIRAVLYSLIDVIVDGMADGRIIRLGELGSFRVSLSSEGKATAAEVNATAIKKSKVLFKPGKRIRNMLPMLEYKKI